LRVLGPVLATAALLGAWMIWPERGLSHVTTTNTVVFDREIVGILDAHCVACHSANGIAESLATYEETWLRRGAVLSSVLTHHMPPWAAVPGYGRFANDNSLTLRESQFLVSWVEGLGPRNDGTVFFNVLDAPTAAQPVAAGNDLSGWALGDPDVIAPMPSPGVDANQGERTERVVLDPGFASETWVRAIEYQPGRGQVVRAATFRDRATGQWLGSWTPWHGHLELPADVAYRMPAGATIVAEVLYATAGQAVADEGTVGLYLGEVTEDIPRDLVLRTRGAVAPDGGPTRFAAEATLDEDVHLLSLLPELEAGIGSIEVSVRRADGGTDVLLFARDISPDWPTPYIFAEPVRVDRGSRLRVVAWYPGGSDAPRPGGLRLTLSHY
jgi:hypothetical protein